MEEKELWELINQGENEKVEFKGSSFLNEKEEIAKELVSFANRAGGWLIIGVKNNKDLEGATIDVDKAVSKISQIAKDKCSPKIDFTYKHFQFKEGDVLCVYVKPRRGMPHAVIQKADGEIKNRIYYIRANNICRLIDDMELEWLFKNVNNELNYNGRIYLIYRRTDLKIPAFDLPRGNTHFIPFVNSLKPTDINYLKEDEKRIIEFFVEIAPFAMLAHLSWDYGNSWLIKREYKRDIIEIFIVDKEIEKEKIDIREIKVPNNSLISNLSIDFQKLPIKSDITVPKNTSIKVDFEQKEDFKKSYLKIEKRKAFSFVFEFVEQIWSFGAYYHPQAAKYYRVDRQKKQVEKSIASVVLKMNFKGNFTFPDIKDPYFIDYYNYGKSIIEMLEKDWDWDKFRETLPQSQFYVIEAKIDEIIELLKKVKNK